MRARERWASNRLVLVPVLLLLGLVGVALLLAPALGRPGFDDTEGRYAEVAREMWITGDWVTPRVNFVVFLNKPPLFYWLVALVMPLVGAGEWLRVASAAAAVGTVGATYGIGALLAGSLAGALAAVALATSPGFLLEARTLRPDTTLTFFCTLAILAALAAHRRSGRRRDLWAAGAGAALGLAVLTKGLVALLVAAGPVAVLGWAEWRGRRPWHGWLVALVAFMVVAIPWHVAAARHPGFLDDYFVNQHVLYFFDRKLPRDSEGIGLGLYLGAFFLRGLPWSALWPAALVGALLALGRGGAKETSAAGIELALAWIAVTVGFFALSPSRQDHYSFPALPAAAVLVGIFAARWIGGELSPRERRVGLGGLGLLTVLFALGPLVAAVAARETYWLSEVRGLLKPAALCFASLAAFALAATLLGLRSRPRGAVAALAVVGLVGWPFVIGAHRSVEPVVSWRPLTAKLRALASPGSIVLFEAPQEYQLCGGLNFYLRRRISLLEPPEFVPPPYLRPYMGDLFWRRDRLATRWTGHKPIFFVSDPTRRRERSAGLVPGPFCVVGRWGDRWLLANPAAAQPGCRLAGRKSTGR